MHYEIYKDVQGYWRWRLKDYNLKIIATSHDSHLNKSTCESEIIKVKNSTYAPVYTV